MLNKGEKNMKKVTIYKKVLAKPTARSRKNPLNTLLMAMLFLAHIVESAAFGEQSVSKDGVERGRRQNSWDDTLSPEWFPGITIEDVFKENPDFSEAWCDAGDDAVLKFDPKASTEIGVNNVGLLANPLKTGIEVFNYLIGAADGCGVKYIGRDFINPIDLSKMEEFSIGNLSIPEFNQVHGYNVDDDVLKVACFDKAQAELDKIIKFATLQCFSESLRAVCNDLSDPFFYTSLGGNPVVFASNRDAALAIVDVFESATKAQGDFCEEIDLSGLKAVDDQYIRGAFFSVVDISKGRIYESEVSIAKTQITNTCFSPAAEELSVIVKSTIENCETSSTSETSTTATPTKSATTPALSPEQQAYADSLKDVCNDLSDPFFYEYLAQEPQIVGSTKAAALTTTAVFESSVKAQGGFCESTNFSGLTETSAQIVNEETVAAVDVSKGTIFGTEINSLGVSQIQKSCFDPAVQALDVVIKYAKANCAPPTEMATSLTKTSTSATKTKTSTSITTTKTQTEPEPDLTITSQTTSLTLTHNDFTTKSGNAITEGEEVTLSPAAAKKTSGLGAGAIVGFVGAVGVALTCVGVGVWKVCRSAERSDDDINMQNAIWAFRSDINTSRLAQNRDQTSRICTESGGHIPEPLDTQQCYYLKNGALYLGYGGEDEQPISNALSAKSTFRALTHPAKSTLTTFYTNKQRENAGAAFDETEFVLMQRGQIIVNDDRRI